LKNEVFGEEDSKRGELFARAFCATILATLAAFQRIERHAVSSVFVNYFRKHVYL